MMMPALISLIPQYSRNFEYPISFSFSLMLARSCLVSFSTSFSAVTSALNSVVLQSYCPMLCSSRGVISARRRTGIFPARTSFFECCRSVSTDLQLRSYPKIFTTSGKRKSMRAVIWFFKRCHTLDLLW